MFQIQMSNHSVYELDKGKILAKIVDKDVVKKSVRIFSVNDTLEKVYFRMAYEIKKCIVRKKLRYQYYRSDIMCLEKKDGKIDYNTLHYIYKKHLDVRYSGAEDARHFIYNGTDYLIFNMAINRRERFMFLMNLTSNKIVKLTINGMKLSVEKNWSPLIHNNELYFVYSLEPIIILKCIDVNKGICRKINMKKSSEQLKTKTNYKMRIGCKFVHLRDDIYFTVAHQKLDGTIIHRPIMVLYDFSNNEIMMKMDINVFMEKSFQQKVRNLLVYPFNIVNVDKSVENKYVITYMSHIDDENPACYNITHDIELLF